MRTYIKKCAAVTAAAVMASQLTACGKNSTWGADIDGLRVPAGVYIYYLQSAYYDALSKVRETKEEGAEVTSADVFASTVEDKPAKQWITDEAVRQMREYAAVENKFGEYGLSLSEEDRNSAQSYCDQMWDYAGEYFSEMGIAQSSYESIYFNEEKKDKLFEAVYGEGGDHAVADAEIKQYMLDNYVLVDYIEMELKDGAGNLLKSEGKAERMAMAEDYVKRYQAGESFESLNNEYRSYYTALKEEAEKAAAESGNTVTAESADGEPQIEWQEVTEDTAKADAPHNEETGEIAADVETPAETSGEANADEELSADEDTQAETTAVTTAETTVETTAETSATTAETTAETAADENSGTASAEISNYPSNKQVVEKDGTYPSEEVVAKAFEMNVGDISIVETKDGEHYYVLARLDLNEDESYFTASKDSLLHEMKSDDYDALIETWVSAQNYQGNAEAVNRYDPVKMFKD